MGKNHEGFKLVIAEIPYIDAQKRYVDFHSLRVSLTTLLAANKVSPRAAQALLRHTDPRLTATVYTDEKLLPLAAELQNVPAIPMGGEGEKTTLLATGREGWGIILPTSSVSGS